MKFIEKVRIYTKKGIDKNIKKEYKEVIKHIESEAKSGRYSAEFNIGAYYENKKDMYLYIMDKLKSDGFNVEFEKYGFGMSHTRLSISWGENYDNKNLCK
ncbi:hypothetical protein [Romboutsia lituseburensis]|uniref:hypothetical protein n=1 Tax=Romboutsia lituseburensis TaxID=1537 RepID=UPI0022EB08F0|nr:hypothetical protein [Romboutsia lituseburensis]